MNFGFSGEMIFLFFLALILFGPKKLPEIGRQIGRIMNEFRRASYEFRSQIESEINSLDDQKQRILPPLKQPLGSLASRIFNMPAEETKGVETRAADKAADSKPAASAEPSIATSPQASIEASPAMPIATLAATSIATPEPAGATATVPPSESPEADPKVAPNA